MNESHPSPSAGGQKRSGLRKDTEPPRTSPLHTSANQESRSNKPSGKWNRRVKVGGEKRTLNRSSADLDTMRPVGVWWLSNRMKKTTYKKHMYTQSEIPESLRARTITHCPPAPPLREGHHSGPDGSANSDPEPPLAPQTPVPQNSPSSLFLSTSFLLCSSSLSLSVAFRLFFFLS